MKLSYEEMVERGVTALQDLDARMTAAEMPTRHDQRVKAVLEAALAQQAQPLTDRDILRLSVDYIPRFRAMIGPTDPVTESRVQMAFQDGAQLLRDRMAQQAQPRCEHGERGPHDVRYGHVGADARITDYTRRCPGPQQARPNGSITLPPDNKGMGQPPQQAQPEMPRGVRFRLQEMLEHAKRTFPDLLSDESIAIYREEIAWLEAALNDEATKS